MGQFVGCMRGIAAACTALDFPVVSGNVSLYNETKGRASCRRRRIGGVGVLDDFTKSATLAFKARGEAILLVGETQGWLGQSLYLREICGREEGAPPPVDLVAERANGDFVRALIGEGLATAVHDLSDGGLLGGGRRNGDGVGHWRRALRGAARHRPHAFWFGEDQARYVVTVREADAEAVMRRGQDAGVPVRRLGATGGDAIALAGERPIAVAALAAKFRGLAAGLHGRRRVKRLRS